MRTCLGAGHSEDKGERDDRPHVGLQNRSSFDLLDNFWVSDFVFEALGLALSHDVTGFTDLHSYKLHYKSSITRKA